MLPTHPTTHPTRVPTRAGAGAHTLPHPLTHTRTHPSTRARTHTHASAHAHAHARSRRSSTRHAPHQRRPAHLRGGSPAPTPRRPEAWRAEPRRAAPGREACSGQPGDRWLVPPALAHRIDAWRPIPCHASLTARAQPCGAREVARRALGCGGDAIRITPPQHRYLADEPDGGGSQPGAPTGVPPATVEAAYLELKRLDPARPVRADPSIAAAAPLVASMRPDDARRRRTGGARGWSVALGFTACLPACACVCVSCAWVSEPATVQGGDFAQLPPLGAAVRRCGRHPGRRPVRSNACRDTPTRH
jgi:hypothetical protein